MWKIILWLMATTALTGLFIIIIVIAVVYEPFRFLKIKISGFIKRERR